MYREQYGEYAYWCSGIKGDQWNIVWFLSSFIGKIWYEKITQKLRAGYFNKSLAIVLQNHNLNYLEFNWIFYLNIDFCEQSQEGQKLAVEGH